MKNNDSVQSLEQHLAMKGLTHRQIDVASCALSDMKAKEIGATLFVSHKTVKFHLTAIYKKLSVKNRTGLMLQLSNFVVSNVPSVTVYPVVEDGELKALPRGVVNEESSEARANAQ